MVVPSGRCASYTIKCRGFNFQLETCLLCIKTITKPCNSHLLIHTKHKIRKDTSIFHYHNRTRILVFTQDITTGLHSPSILRIHSPYFLSALIPASRASAFFHNRYCNRLRNSSRAGQSHRRESFRSSWSTLVAHVMLFHSGYPRHVNRRTDSETHSILDRFRLATGFADHLGDLRRIACFPATRPDHWLGGHRHGLAARHVDQQRSSFAISAVVTRREERDESSRRHGAGPSDEHQ